MDRDKNTDRDTDKDINTDVVMDMHPKFRHVYGFYDCPT
jgi:hypothetical protein